MHCRSLEVTDDIHWRKSTKTKLHTESYLERLDVQTEICRRNHQSKQKLSLMRVFPYSIVSTAKPHLMQYIHFKPK